MAMVYMQYMHRWFLPTYRKSLIKHFSKWKIKYYDKRHFLIDLISMLIGRATRAHRSSSAAHADLAFRSLPSLSFSVAHKRVHPNALFPLVLVARATSVLLYINSSEKSCTSYFATVGTLQRIPVQNARLKPIKSYIWKSAVICLNLEFESGTNRFKTVQPIKTNWDRFENRLVNC